MNRVADKLNRPLRDLRISVTDQCNFRCSYCMPREIFGPEYAFLPKDKVLSNEEIVFVAKSFAQLGVQKIRLTGGEPLLRPNLSELIAIINTETSIKDISLTTNASLLPRYAQKLKDAGLKRINISLDSLDTDRFALMSGGRSSPEAVIRGIDAAEKAGLPVKINMVAKLGVNEQDILPMVSYFRGRKITLRFIEFMDVGETNAWKMDQVVPAKRILETIGEHFQFEAVDPSYTGEVASRYRFLDTGSEFGIITSITSPFCGTCNRARISAEGKLFTCLFASEGTDLRKHVRAGISQEEFTSLVSKIWISRDDQYSEDRSKGRPSRSNKKVEMSYIGG
ncbi:GTP 3',8-cyclase MoaA [Pelagicoccus sp. SDUM812002]|uniref:GTP 3',8-cyclase MoaA n=1 Tax=Pelagicoccus sp. SDUM812002 TaxID=3041266 RepID=UPI00280CEECB|nr:GTP 3',8-cyclase MoaA [Pelagicoccus sp. SDUM812002]MDQ8184730.1 GTP 3',8-cyclase MoaA [Pelagicoccus sp. SDUM812002]